MWLDRLSGHPQVAGSPSQAPSRNFSPAPRRSLQAQRPSLPNRTTSLSVLSNNVSTSSLSSAARLPGSSSLKDQISTSPPEEVEDPITVLERVLGVSVQKEQTKDVQDDAPKVVERLDKPAGLSESLDIGQLSLQEFVEENEALQITAAELRSGSTQTIEEYGNDKEQFEDLHTSILNCDNVLNSVESYLARFQKELSHVSAEIETLQSRSSMLNEKLEKRQTAEKQLGPVVERIALSPAVVRKLSDGPIDVAFTISLEELQERQKAVEKDVSSKDEDKIKAIEDLRPLISNLSDKVIERIRDYFGSRIRSLRSPNINAQILQQQDFLRYKMLYAFLAARQPELAHDLLQAYTNTMRWYYATHFTRYREALSRLRLHMTDRSDTLGEDPSASLRPSNSSATHIKLPGSDPFTLGRRVDILRQPNSSALPASVAEESKIPVHLETPFLAFNLALLDNASAEYAFLSSFLPMDQPSTFPHNLLAHTITAIFTPTFELGYALTRSLTSDSYDTIGLLLTVRLTQHFAFTLQRRRNPTLDAYVNGTSMLLWPRFQQTLDAHIESLRRLTSSLPSRPGGGAGAASAAFASLSGSSSGAASTAPHPVTQRFANLLSGILALSAEARDDEPVGSSVARLRGEFEAFLGKMAQGFGSGEKGKKERVRFLGNNYSLVMTVLDGVNAGGKLAVECKELFQEYLR